tara:strand:+ start:890 stop:1030 length:141 start_codon:yes stop_codon:yes gene_type:complete
MCLAQVPLSSIAKMDHVDALAWLKRQAAANKDAKPGEKAAKTGNLN